MPATPLTLVAALVETSQRTKAARELAAYLGAEDLVIFVKDDELGAFLPALGFPKTLPDGRAWRAFLAECAKADPGQQRLLPYPASDTVRLARGVTSDACILVLLGGEPRADRMEEIRPAMPLLASLFAAERRAQAGEAHAAVARVAADRAEALALSLGTSQSELHRVLHRLQTSEEWLKVTLGSIGDAVIATDAQGRISLMNAAAEAVTGWRLGDATSRPVIEVFDIINEYTRARVENPVDRVIRE